MFIPIEEEPTGLRPHQSNFTENDWAILARYWYPVAVVGDVTDAPVAGKLLDIDLVIYRSGETITVARDLCPHRHIRLSAGTMDDGRIVCPFHGLAFDGTGQCVRVPALGRDAKLPKSYRLHTVRSEVRYGFIWACLDSESQEAIPDFPPANDIDPAHLAFGTPRDWPCSAARQVENFTDLAHLPFVHPKTLGGDQFETIAPARVEHTNDAVEFRARYLETPDGERDMLMDFTYIVKLPFMIDFETWEVGTPAPDIRMINFPVPISAHMCRVFTVIVLDGPYGSPESGPGPGDAVNSEDIEILKHLASQDLPLTARHEIHLPVDNVSMEYRKRLRDLGLGQGAPRPGAFA